MVLMLDDYGGTRRQREAIANPGCLPWRAHEPTPGVPVPLPDLLACSYYGIWRCQLTN